MDTFVIYSTYYSCEFDVTFNSLSSIENQNSQVYKFPFDKQDCYYCFIMFNYNAQNELRFNAKIAPRAYIYVSILVYLN